MVRLVVFMVVMPVLWILLHIYMDRRLVRGSALGRTARLLARIPIVLSAVMPVVAMSGTRLGLATWLARPLAMLGFFFMGLSSIVLVLLVAIDLGRLVHHGWARARLRWFPRPTVDAAVAPADVDPGRRGFFAQVANLGVVGTASTVAGVGLVQIDRTPGVVEVDVPIEGLPAALEGFRIVQMTDIHVGPTIRGEYLQRCVDVCNGLDADVVAITGDLIDGFVDQLRADVAPLAGLQAKRGVYFVTGNHEYYWDGPAWCAEVTRLGLQVLDNRHVVIERDGAKLLLAGITDVSAGSMVADHASDPVKALVGAPAVDLKIVLAHQPRSVFAAAAAGFDLQISGHTHGGQYFPMNLLVYFAQPYVAGLERHESMWIYVSRGTGYWGPPTRVGAPPEITLLRLVRAPA
jgi:hypothetical protein